MSMMSMIAKGMLSVVLLSVLVAGNGVRGEPPTAAAATTVQCGANLNIPGQYVLTQNLNCPGVAITVSANDVHFNLAGYTISSTDGLGIGIAVGDVVGGDWFGGMCVPMEGTLVELHGNGGAIKGFFFGVHLCHVNGVHLNGLTIRENTTGIRLDSAHFNRVNGNNISFNRSYGVRVANGDGNQFNTNTVTDNFSPECKPAPLTGTRLFSCGGFELFNACHNTVLSSNTVLRNGDVGIWLRNSLSMTTTIRGNTVMDTNNYGVPTTNIALTENAHDNVIQGNTTGATTPGISADGINVGCKGGCTFLSGPSTGVNNNLIQSNTANNNARYGIAQASGNTGNTYKSNSASGNFVANFAID